VDPISAIGIATTAYNAIKKGFQVGKEIESMSKDLGRWMGAIQEVKEGHKKAKGGSYGSVEEEALESFAALKKAQQMENELRTFVNMNYGPNAWAEVLRIQANIRNKKKEALKEAKRKQAQRIENVILGVLLMFFLGAVGAVLYLILTVE
jgi:molecular chaperone GrpE (heat shock protein)